MIEKESLLSRLERQLATVQIVSSSLVERLGCSDARRILRKEGITWRANDHSILLDKARQLGSERRNYLGTLAVAYDLFADDLDKGIPVIDSLQDLVDSLSVPDLCSAFATARKDVERGKLLYEDLARSKAFSPTDIAYVRIAESTGELSSTLRVLAERARYERGTPSWLGDDD